MATDIAARPLAPEEVTSSHREHILQVDVSTRQNAREKIASFGSEGSVLFVPQLVIGEAIQMLQLADLK